MLPAKTTTIEEFVQSGKSVSLTYKNFSFHETLTNGTQVSVFDVVNDYIMELRTASVTVKLNDDEYRKYCYKPKLLCYDIYGNPELYFIILLINDIADVKEFNKKSFYMLSKEYMSMLTSYIYNSERRAIAEYNTKYSGQYPSSK